MQRKNTYAQKKSSMCALHYNNRLFQALEHFLKATAGTGLFEKALNDFRKLTSRVALNSTLDRTGGGEAVV